MNKFPQLFQGMLLSRTAFTAHYQADCDTWGLTPAKCGELKAELQDHLKCLQSEAGNEATSEVEHSLASPASIRRLAAPHMADQVYATLNRWPTRQEWRELLILLAWFALILLADALASWAAPQFDEWRFYVSPSLPPPAAALKWLEVATWVLQAVGRAGFFVALALSLLRAWKIGAGVCLARVLQLKLIHTVLVAAALIGLGRFIWTDDFWGFGYTLPWPDWLTAQMMLGTLLALALSTLVLTRGRAWAAALGIALAAAFMYPGGPLAVYESRITKPLAYTWQQHPGQPSTIVLETDKAKIVERAAKVRRWHRLDESVLVDETANRFTYSSYFLHPTVGAYLNRGEYDVHLDRSGVDYGGMHQERNLGQWGITGPLAAPGGGIGWLAVPIPLFGIVGFLGLLSVMGRRSTADLGLYAVLCGLGLLTNLMPFYVASEVTNSIFRLEPLAVMTSPFIGFEYLLAAPEMWNFMAVTLVLGLLFSAAVPWLLAALFLKPVAAGTDISLGGLVEES